MSLARRSLCERVAIVGEDLFQLLEGFGNDLRATSQAQFRIVSDNGIAIDAAVAGRIFEIKFCARLRSWKPSHISGIREPAGTGWNL